MLDSHPELAVPPESHFALTPSVRSLRRARDGSEESWIVLGASRGESGILGEGVRQALLRDPTYLPALNCARVFVT